LLHEFENRWNRLGLQFQLSTDATGSRASF
jgi:hypothetical protein